MRLSVFHDDTSFDLECFPGGGHVVDVWLDGVKLKNVLRFDDARGFVDRFGSHANGQQLMVYRIFGKVRIHHWNRITNETYYSTPEA